MDEEHKLLQEQEKKLQDNMKEIDIDSPQNPKTPKPQNPLITFTCIMKVHRVEYQLANYITNSQ